MFLQNFKGKKVLITGHTGFKGSWLSAWLIKLGADICGYSKDIPSDPAMFDCLNIQDDINHNIADILDKEALNKIFSSFKPEIVFHLAAQPIVSESVSNPLLTYETNIIGTANVLECIRKNNSVKSAIMITSDKCYENVEWEYGYRENDALGGKDPYSASKAGAEIVFSSFYRTFLTNERKDLGICTVRAGNVIGGGDWAQDRIVPDTVKSWSKNESVFLRNPIATRPWQHVLEPLSGYLLLAQKLYGKSTSFNGTSFNFGPSSDVIKSVEELIDEMSNHWDGSKKDISSVNTDFNESSLLKLSCDKALKDLSWSPTLSFEETAQFTIDWYLKFYLDNKKNIREYTMNQIDHYESLFLKRNKEIV
ncbi:MAG: CDP-glucose 4,6-dehydratase [Flavobacteriaceae bacterium]|nr:CDP-glucose 4,6-dehydratase [Flavobacteriaceae bacterium]